MQFYIVLLHKSFFYPVVHTYYLESYPRLTLLFHLLEFSYVDKLGSGEPQRSRIRSAQH